MLHASTLLRRKKALHFILFSIRKFIYIYFRVSFKTKYVAKNVDKFIRILIEQVSLTVCGHLRIKENSENVIKCSKSPNDTQELLICKM